MIEHQPVNYKLSFLSEERMFSLIVDLNKTILAAFITRLVKHPEKQNETAKQQCTVPQIIANFLDIPV